MKIKAESDLSNIKISKEIEQELKNFQKKLTNLNKRNRNIWSSKSTIYNFSIFNLEEDQLLKLDNFLKKNIKDLKLNLNLKNLNSDLLNLKNFNLFFWKDNQKIYINKKIKKSLIKKTDQEKSFLIFNNIEKENKKIKNEIGYETLYFIPYYFLTNFSNANKIIPIRSPIFLVPITLILDNNLHKVKMYYDDTRDIIINNFIVENFLKEEEYYFDYEKSFLENIKKLFLNLKKNKKEINNYIDSYNDYLIDFKNYNNTEKFDFLFRIEKSFTIGFFDKYDNAVKRDLNLILKDGYFTKQLEKYSLVNKKSSKKEILSSFFDDDKKNQYNFDEKGLFYVDNLNDQQFYALKKINDDKVKNFVIWGPPGTGKSQTILSIIYDAILKNKKIALISEKRAALDVIYQRLKSLNKFAFYLTDINNKGDFYYQINKSYESSRKILEEEDYIFTSKEKFNEEINKIDNLSSKIFTNLKKMDSINFYKNVDFFGNKKIYELIEDNYFYFKNFNYFLTKNISDEKINAFILEQGKKNDNFYFYLAKINDLFKNNSISKIEKMIEIKEEIVKNYGVEFTKKNDGEISDYFNLLISGKKLNLKKEETHTISLWKNLIENWDEKKYKKTLEYFSNDKLSSFLIEYSIDRFEQLFKFSYDLIYLSFFNFFFVDYINLVIKNNFNFILFSNFLNRDVIEEKYLNAKNDFDILKKQFLIDKKKYDKKFSNVKKDLQAKQSMTKMIVFLQNSFYKLRNYELSKRKIEDLYNKLFFSNLKEQKELITKYKKEEQILNLQFNQFEVIKDLEEEKFEFLKNFLNYLKNEKVKFDKTLQIIEFKIFRERINKYQYIFELREKIFNWKDNYKNFLDLRKTKIKKFSEIAKSYLAKNFLFTYENSNSQFKRIVSDPKKRIGVKTFLKNEGETFKNLYRIWLLNPETISSIFDLKDQFDLVIFDEASQMFIERSLPSIARSKKVVILGDEKQLAPTNFFISRNVDEEFEKFEEEHLIDNKLSLLNYGKTKFPHIMLKYHYRSNFKELIEYSDNVFYNNNLTFISKNGENKDFKPIEYFELKDSFYRSGLNYNEVDKIIEILYQIKNDNKLKDKSIGIITMNSKQEKYLFEKILNISYNDSNFSNWINNEKINLFIKNIENVQGDERDIIIFSTLYGKNEEGKILFNFGPINKYGGVNRINVAITRSKLKMYVITSIMQSDFENFFIRNQAHKNNLESGIYVLYKFLKYCIDSYKNKNKLKSEVEIDKFNSKFEKDLYFEFKKIAKRYNLSVINRDQTYGYKSDFLFFTKNHKVLLLIESDQAIKNSYKSTREKDISNQDFLKVRGYNFYRVWIFNWFNDQKNELKNIEKIIRNNI
ncbi:/ / putative DNA helicase / 629680:633741 Reverse [Candidatus Hepatoplasma crinochetorum]|uniref:/ / putative DNA helicase / 629680:633741 Reverse n=1 Tax=Candidatus Hepatoplasma crinochetorum TaxID=295596 RepID=A0A0G7ZNG6_9MOLU|nr:/ / putative DNA helicase / 629680:633741 Reverse [Candidatus Hepatoplasma crinochetorum]